MAEQIAMMAEGTTEITPADPWVMLCPTGDVSGRDGRQFRVVNAVEVVKRSQSPGDLPVDYEHQSEAPTKGEGGPRPAAGWIEELEARPDGIYGRVNWTDKAARMIADREYRFLSPVFMHTANRVVTRIVGAGLTHRPNLELKALSSAQQADDVTGDRVAEIADAAGLDPSATFEELIAFCRDASAGHTARPDPAKFVPIEVVAELTRDRAERIATMSEMDAERRVEAAMEAGHLTPAMRQWAVALCCQEPERFDQFVKASPAPYAHLGRKVMTADRVADLNRAIGGQRGGSGLPGPGDEEKSICRQLGITSLND
ncbi:phage protease [Jannaschia rubra]|uniref:phage protease n=1 Tax=Jannaschia rubra TaxID=282197 RepID=UPI0024924314|nr:phage protease [Jannaschia rubra]